MLAHLRLDYFHEFRHSIPLGKNYWANLWENDAYDSFSEIFIQQEYEDFIPDEPLTNILDLGAHYGYFSLWLQSRYPEIELYSLLIEPSPNCARSLFNLVNQDKLRGRFSYLQRAIASEDIGESSFYDRPYMASSRYPLSQSEKATQVQNLSETDLMEALKPPYDLIKCDIEGSEWEFLNNYQNIIKESKYLVLEWHSWHNGGGGFQQIEKLLHSLEFSTTCSSQPMPAVGREGEVGLILVKNRNL